MLVLGVALTLSFTSCKPKDADISAAITAKIKEMPDMAGLTVDVKDGVATMSGVCKDETCKTNCATAVTGIKGVKSVVNNCTIAPPPPPPVEIGPDAEMTTKVMEALKDMSGITGSVKDGIISLTGTKPAAEKLKALMMVLQTLKPKKVDVTGLK